jgi:hypothetical protein
MRGQSRFSSTLLSFRAKCHTSHAIRRTHPMPVPKYTRCHSFTRAIPAVTTSGTSKPPLWETVTRMPATLFTSLHSPLLPKLRDMIEKTGSRQPRYGRLVYDVRLLQLHGYNAEGAQTTTVRVDDIENQLHARVTLAEERHVVASCVEAGDVVGAVGRCLAGGV